MCTLHLTVCTKCAHMHRFNLLQCATALRNIRSNSQSVQHVRDPEDPVAMPMSMQRAQDPYVKKLRAEATRAEGLRAERREGDGAACRTVVKQTRVSLCGCCPRDGLAGVDVGEGIDRGGPWVGDDGMVEMASSGKWKGKGKEKGRDETYVDGMQIDEGYDERTIEGGLDAQQKACDRGHRLRMMEILQAKAETAQLEDQSRSLRGCDPPDEADTSVERLMTVMEMEEDLNGAPRNMWEKGARVKKGESRDPSDMKGMQRERDENMLTTELMLDAEERAQYRSRRTEFETNTQNERDRLLTGFHQQLHLDGRYPWPICNPDYDHIPIKNLHMDNEHAASMAQGPSLSQSQNQSRPTQRQVWQHQSQLQRANRGSGEDNRSEESKTAELKSWKNREEETGCRESGRERRLAERRRSRGMISPCTWQRRRDFGGTERGSSLMSIEVEWKQLVE